MAAANTAEILRLAPAQEAPEWESKLDLIKRSVAAGATSDELDLFFYQARRTGLDPLARQIYYVKRKGKGTIQVGIDGLRLIADRTGQYAGSDDAEFLGTTDEGQPAKARVTVYKMVQGQRCPFTATARWDEYYPGPDQGFQWRKMPHAMLAKCAEALALRKAFPADMSGLYVHEEMMQADGGTEQTPLEGPALKEAADRVFDVPQPESKSAFGYIPVRWPLAKMFAEPITDNQRKMIVAKAAERMIPEEDLNTVRRMVLEAYGLADEPTKACASLFIDWLINAEEPHLDAAVEASEKARMDNEPLELEA